MDWPEYLFYRRGLLVILHSVPLSWDFGQARKAARRLVELLAALDEFLAVDALRIRFSVFLVLAYATEHIITLCTRLMWSTKASVGLSLPMTCAS